MSATYNWAYRPGVVNKYGFTVPAGADNVRPTGWCYVALFGNDVNGNGSRQYPYRTITKALTLGNSMSMVLGSGVYRETAIINPGPIINAVKFIGDGDVVIDISYNNSLLQTCDSCYFYNLNVRGSGSSTLSVAYFYYSYFTDVFFDGAAPSTSSGNGYYLNCVIKGYSSQLILNDLSSANIMNTTFISCNNVQLVFSNLITTGRFSACLFFACNISTNNSVWYQKITYTLFYYCNFKLSAGISTGGVLYPNGTPAGYTYYSTMTSLQAAYYALYSTSSFSGCTITDPLFNNFIIGDFTLAFNSPAKNLSYFGTYVGARSIAYPIKAKIIESAGGFEFASAVNLTIVDDSITLTNQALDGQVDTKVLVNTLAREIAKLPNYGFNADRNGQYIDSISDLATSVKNAGDAITPGIPYIVEGAAITCNSVIYQPGDRFTVAASITSFTSAGGGALREILEAPQRHTIMARFSDGGSVITAGTPLVTGNYYHVSAGAATYNSVYYADSDVFKAIDNNSFTGSGTVILAFSSEAFQHYEPGIRPTSNNTGDLRTGAIVRGNGDPDYDRGGIGIKEFPINAKYIQVRYYIKVNNLKP
jgi:hypothetical protein